MGPRPCSNSARVGGLILFVEWVLVLVIVEVGVAEVYIVVCCIVIEVANVQSGLVCVCWFVLFCLVLVLVFVFYEGIFCSFRLLRFILLVSTATTEVGT